MQYPRRHRKRERMQKATENTAKIPTGMVQNELELMRFWATQATLLYRKALAILVWG